MVFISKNFLIVFGMLFFLLALISFQQTGDGLKMELSPSCLKNSNFSSPLEMMDNNPSQCTNEDLDNVEKFYQLIRKKGIYSVHKNGINIGTWYNDKFQAWENKWIAWLAIIASDAIILHEDKNRNIIVFTAKINNTLAIWAWKLNGNTRPIEMKFIDLQAGNEANEDFTNYLKTGSNFHNSRLPEILDKWINEKREYCVKAILPNPCGTSINIDPSKNPTEGQLEGYFNPMDILKKTPQPQCITDVINQNSNTPLLNLLVEKKTSDKSSYEVWLKGKTSPVIPTNWYTDLLSKNPSLSPLWSWLAIALVANCKAYEIPGTQAIISICDTVITCYRDRNNKLDEYRPLDLLDKNDQKILCMHLMEPANYNTSPLKTLIEKEWYEESKEFKVISYFDNRNIDGADSDLIGDLVINDRLSTFSAKYFLVEQHLGSGRNDYFTWSGSGAPGRTWYNSDLDKFKNPWIGRLAIADPNAKILSFNLRQKTFSFIVSKSDNYLWSWRLKSNDRPDEYAPLKNLYDKSSTGKAIAIAYAKAIKANSGLFDTYLQKNIGDYFNGNDEKIIQVYPQNFTKKSDSPFGILGESDPPNTSNKMPQPLFDVFSSVGHTATSKMQYIVENDRGDFSIKGSSNTSPNISWFKGVSHFKDPWVAWLCLADPNMKLVAANPGTPTRLCMTLSEDYSTLWSWDANLNPQDAPIQKKLVEKESKFELSGNPIKDYLMLPLSDEEKTFFLSRADQNDKISFVLSDFFEYIPYDSNRILLWRINSPSERKLFRVGKGINQDEAITVHQVDQNKEQAFAWDEISTRYKQAWFTGSFKEHLARTNLTSLDTWFGKQRLGISMGDQVGVFLDNARYRSFGFTGFSNINSLVNDIVYISLGRVKPEKNVFFHSWVDGKWDRTIWRANPLGLFDRVANSKSSNQ